MPSKVPSPFSASIAIDRLRELFEAARGDLLEDLLLAAEVTVGRCGGDARDAAGVGEREVLRAALLDELTRRPDQRLAQLTVMIAGLAPHFVRRAFSHGRHNATPHEDLKS